MNELQQASQRCVDAQAALAAARTRRASQKELNNLIIEDGRAYTAYIELIERRSNESSME